MCCSDFSAQGDSAINSTCTGGGNLNLAAAGAQSLASCGEGSGNVALGASSAEYQQDVANSVFDVDRRGPSQSGRGASTSDVKGEWNIEFGARSAGSGYSLGYSSRFNILTYRRIVRLSP